MPRLQENPTLASLRAEAAQRFLQQFGREPEVIAAAPGRANLIGEHIDYCGGTVLPFAIERYTVAAVGQNDQPNLCRAISSLQDGPVTFAFDEAREANRGWHKYLQGVIAGFLDLGVKMSGIDVAVVSSVPPGAGLSSSAALEVALGVALMQVMGKPLSAVALAKLAQSAEHEYAQVPCGIMDQFASVLAERNHLLRLDCQTEAYQQVRLDDPDVALLLVHSGVKHDLSASAYAKRRQICEASAAALGVSTLCELPAAELDHVLGRLPVASHPFVRHVLSENQRTHDGVSAIERRDFARLGGLLFASHASLRDDFGVSCDELDALVEIAAALRGEGVFGARLMGGGFGGATIWLVAADQVNAIASQAREQYSKRYGITPLCFVTRPGPGAMQILGGGGQYSESGV